MGYLSAPSGSWLQFVLSTTVELRSMFWCSVLAFIGFSVVGYVVTTLYPGSADVILGRFEEFAEHVLSRPDWQVALLIFFNNFITVFLTATLGVFGGVYPVVVLAMNGYLFGVVAQLIAAEEGWGTFVAGTLPHGIIELPAVLLGCALGLHLGRHFYQRFFNKQSIDLFNETKRAAWYAVVFLAPLLIIGSLIESFVTPLLLGV